MNKLSTKQIINRNKSNGFTIVELLIVVVVIGILAAITIVAFTGISKRAVSASMQSDLSNATNQLKMYNVYHGTYPTSLDANNCPLGTAPSPDPAYCLKKSNGNSYIYSNSSPQTFSLTETNTNGTVYTATESFTPMLHTGTLVASATPTIAAGTNPYGIVISSDGTSVYATNATSNTISMYKRSTSTGILTALATPTIATGTSPYRLAISANGTSVYATNNGSNTISMYSRNTSTGVLTALATPTIATGTNPYRLAITADGTSVYATNYTSSNISIYSRNTSTGVLTANGTIATGTNPRGIAISADGTSIYAANVNSNTISLYSRN